MWNVSKRKNIYIPDFSDFYFSRYGENLSKIDHIFSTKNGLQSGWRMCWARKVGSGDSPGEKCPEYEVSGVRLGI